MCGGKRVTDDFRSDPSSEALRPEGERGKRRRFDMRAGRVRWRPRARDTVLAAVAITNRPAQCPSLDARVQPANIQPANMLSWLAACHRAARKIRYRAAGARPPCCRCTHQDILCRLTWIVIPARGPSAENDSCPLGKLGRQA
jgi:hypothetical protein